MKNKTIMVLLILFIIANTTDGITSYFIRHAEANPLVVLTNSMILMYALKIIFMGAIIYWCWRNIYPSPFFLYLTVMILLLGALVFSLGAYSNIYGMTHKEVLEASAALPAKEKVIAYVSFVSAIYVMPMALSLFGFKCYEWSAKKSTIDRTYFKKQKWWQF